MPFVMLNMPPCAYVNRDANHATMFTSNAYDCVVIYMYVAAAGLSNNKHTELN